MERYVVEAFEPNTGEGYREETASYDEAQERLRMLAQQYRWPLVRIQWLGRTVRWQAGRVRGGTVSHG